MKRIVVDSTVCVNWFMQAHGKRERGAALDLLEYVRRKKVYASQPSIWRAHVASLLLRKRGIDIGEVIETLLAVESREQNSPDVLRLAADLAATLRVDLFDTLYHAVAIDTGIELITANVDYIQRASHLGHIRLLSDWAARARVAERDKRYSRRDPAETPEIRQKKR